MEDCATEEESKQTETDETEIEVSVQVSDPSGTLDNRYSFVILDVKEQPDDTARGRINTKGKGELATSSTAVKKANGNGPDEQNSQSNGRGNNGDERKKSVIIAESAKGETAAKEPEQWKKNLVLSRIHCVYINYSVWGCLHFLIQIIYSSVLSRNNIRPDAFTIIFTAAISLLVFINVWVCFTLENTVIYKWFKASLFVSCVTCCACLVHLIVTVLHATSIDRWTFIMGLSMCFVFGAIFALLMTSSVAIFVLSFAALKKTKKKEETSEDNGATEQAEAAKVRPAIEDFNTASAFRCVIVLFLSGTLTALTGVFLAISPCSVIWLYAMSLTFVVLFLIVIGVRNHMKKEKSEFLWWAFLWLSTLALVMSFLTAVFAIVDMARLGRPCRRSIVVSVILDLLLLFATMVNAIILIRMLWLATRPFRKKEDEPSEGVNGTEVLEETTHNRSRFLSETSDERPSQKRLSGRSSKTM